MLPRDILKIRSSEIAGKVHFLFISAFSKFSRRATELHEMGLLTESMKSEGAHAPVPPISHVHASISPQNDSVSIYLDFIFHIFCSIFFDRLFSVTD